MNGCKYHNLWVYANFHCWLQPREDKGLHSTVQLIYCVFILTCDIFDIRFMFFDRTAV